MFLQGICSYETIHNKINGSGSAERIVFDVS